jgi:hypothetical protein
MGDGDVVRNNIVSENTVFGIDGTALTDVAFNNTFDNGAAGYGGGVAPSDIRRGDPMFVDPVAGDFTLAAGSPAIDAGDPDPAYTDLDGTPNDLGAFGGPGSP